MRLNSCLILFVVIPWKACASNNKCNICTIDMEEDNAVKLHKKGKANTDSIINDLKWVTKKYSISIIAIENSQME